MSEFLKEPKIYFHFLYAEPQNKIEKKENNKYIYIEGEKCNNLKNTFGEFAKKMKFPTYFSYNWDSFDECINDLEWLDRDEYIIIIKNSERLLMNDNENFKYMFEILKCTAYDWNNGNNSDNILFKKIPFHIIFMTEEINKNIEKTLIEMKIDFDIITR